MMISAVIPAYNAEDTIARALRSVLDQTCPVDEIIVVDDGSTDGTGEIVQKQFPQVTYICQDNQGAAAARNRGIEAASGDWIAFLDADDEWLPEKTRRQKQVIEAHPAVSGVACLIIAVRNSREFWERSRLPLGTVYPVHFRDMWHGTSFFIGASYMFRKDALNSIGSFDVLLRSAEDSDLLLRFAARGHQLMVLQDHLYVHHQTAKSLTRGGSGQALRARLIITVLEKWNPKTTPQPSLLSQAEYEVKIRKAYSAAVRNAALCHVALGPEFYHRAWKVCGSSLLCALHFQVAHSLPFLYRAWLLAVQAVRGIAGRVVRSFKQPSSARNSTASSNQHESN